MTEDEERYCHEMQNERDEYEYQLSLESEALAELEMQLEEEKSNMNDNITEIKTLDYEDQVNSHLSLGWILLGFVPVTPVGNLEQQHGKHQKYILGKPRQYPCGAKSFGHTEPKQYSHETGKWYCPACKEEELERKAKGEKYDNVPF